MLAQAAIVFVLFAEPGFQLVPRARTRPASASARNIRAA